MKDKGYKIVRSDRFVESMRKNHKGCISQPDNVFLFTNTSVNGKITQRGNHPVWIQFNFIRER